MNKQTKIALFGSIGQITQYLPIMEAIAFPTKGIGHTWYQDSKGNVYSLFTILSLIY